MTSSSLLPLIETMAKERGVESAVIIAALEDAMLTASRKYYKSSEDLRAKFNAESGQIELYAVKHIVDTVANPATEISLDADVLARLDELFPPPGPNGPKPAPEAYAW